MTTSERHIAAATVFGSGVNLALPRVLSASCRHRSCPSCCVVEKARQLTTDNDCTAALLHCLPAHLKEQRLCDRPAEHSTSSVHPFSIIIVFSARLFCWATRVLIGVDFLHGNAFRLDVALHDIWLCREGCSTSERIHLQCMAQAGLQDSQPR